MKRIGGAFWKGQNRFDEVVARFGRGKLDIQPAGVDVVVVIEARQAAGQIAKRRDQLGEGGGFFWSEFLRFCRFCGLRWRGLGNGFRETSASLALSHLAGGVHLSVVCGVRG